jgi:hypothetical protein
MRQGRVSRKELVAWIALQSVRSWPDNSMVRHLRALFSSTANRLIVGGIGGFGFGACAAMVGIRLSGIDMSNAAMFGQMLRIVVAFAGGGTIVLAFLVHFIYVYFRFLEANEREWWRRKSLGVDRGLWDRDLDGVPTVAGDLEADTERLHP